MGLPKELLKTLIETVAQSEEERDRNQAAAELAGVKTVEEILSELDDGGKGVHCANTAAKFIGSRFNDVLQEFVWMVAPLEDTYKLVSLQTARCLFQHYLNEVDEKIGEIGTDAGKIWKKDGKTESKKSKQASKVDAQKLKISSMVPDEDTPVDRSSDGKAKAADEEIEDD